MWIKYRKFAFSSHGLKFKHIVASNKEKCIFQDSSFKRISISEIHQMLKKEKEDKSIYIFTKAQVMEDFVGIEHHKEVPMPALDINPGDISASIRQIKRVTEAIRNELNERRKHKLQE